MKHRVETKHSIWVFDEDSKMVTRVPKTEDPSHEVPYEAPREYDYIVPREGAGGKWFIVFYPDDHVPIETGRVIKEEMIE